MLIQELKLERRAISLMLAASMLAGATLALSIPAADAQMRLRGNVSWRIREANRLYEVGKLEQAEATYTNLLKRNPNDTKARSGLAIVQADRYKLGAAEKNAQEVLAKDPNNPYAHIALGVVYRNQTASSDMNFRTQRDELLRKAVDEYKKAIAIDPNNAEAYNRLGEVYRQAEQTSDAAQAFNKAVELDPDFSEAVANKGTVLQEQGKLEEALQSYERAIQLNSKNYKAHYFKGDVLTQLGRYHDALSALNIAQYQESNSAMVYTKKGEALEKQGNESGAIANYREAIRRKPEYFPAYQNLARIFDSRGDGELAVAELRSALNANPGLAPLKMDLARLSLSVDKPEQAIDYYQQVLQKDPYNAEALKGLSQAYIATAEKSAGQGILGGSDKYVDAEEAINRALEAYPNDISLHLAALQVGKLSGQPQMARNHLERILMQPATTDSDKLAHGEALFALGRYQESDAYFRQLMSEYRTDSKKMLVLADTMKINGDLDMATEVYNQILATSPNSLKAQRGLQRVENLKQDAGKKTNLANSFNNWYSKKQRKSALDFYLESASQYPRQPEVRLSLAKLFEKDDQYGKAALEYEAFVNLSPDMEPKQKENYRAKIEKLNQKAYEQVKAMPNNNPGNRPPTSLGLQ
ncbi:MAG: tetratricopeptide repeat protein [Candidatus Melainabacteria bacterium]